MKLLQIVSEEIVSMYGNHRLKAVKNLLMVHFGHQRNESCLLLDLSVMSQYNTEILMEFYARVVSSLSLFHICINFMKMLQK